jgi:hypothetical protein
MHNAFNLNGTVGNGVEHCFSDYGIEAETWDVPGWLFETNSYI